MDRILSIDPGGKSGIYFTDGTKEEFLEINETWKENYLVIKELVQQKQANLVLFEDTNYIHKRTKDGLNLFRLLGAIECLEVEKVERVNVLKVKELTKQLFKGVRKIEGLEYQPGRGKGWMYKNKRISIHQLEAYLVYWLWLEQQNIVGTTINYLFV